MANSSEENDRAKEIGKYLKVLAQVRLPFEDQIDNILRFVNHSRRMINDKDMMKGQKTGLEVYSDAAILAKNILVDGMVGALCPRNSRWYTYELPGKLNFPHASGMRSWSGKRMDEYPQIRKWLQAAEEVTYFAYNYSNFYDVITEFVSDAVGPGTAHMMIEEEVAQGKINFTVPHFRECFIAENQWGRVDTNYRVYKLTLRQLVDKFSLGRMTEIDHGFAKAYEDNIHSEREIIHAVYPRSDYSGRIDGKGKKIASIWVLRGGSLGTGTTGQPGSDTCLIEESGYDSLPCTTWRWRKNSDESYGRSPSWDSWVSVALSNQQGRTNTIAGQKMAEPPLVAPRDLRGQINRGPNGQTFIDTKQDIRTRAPFPLNERMQLPYSVEAQTRTEKIINEHFYTGFFQMLLQMAMNKVTASPTQVIEMMGEQAAVLGTRIGNFQSEGLFPIQDRVFEIEAKAGRIPDPPQILLDIQGNKAIQIAYLGPLSQAQERLTRIRTIQSTLEQLKPLAEIFGPMALDRVDVDETVGEILDAGGFPASCERDQKRIDAIRQNRQKAAEQQQKLEAMKVIPKAAAAAGKAAQDGSPLQKLMGGDQENGG
jgi:hypothetical protein